jgi:hypothetical protein
MSDIYDDFETYDELEHDINPWSQENRNMRMKPFKDLFAAMSPEELAEWSAVTISPERLVFLRGGLEPGLVKNANRALERQLAKPEIAHVPSAFFFDFIFDEVRTDVEKGQGGAARQVWQVHMHGTARVPANSPESEHFEAVLKWYYKGFRSIKISEMYDATGWFNYGLKDQTEPSKRFRYFRNGKRTGGGKHPVTGAPRAELRRHLSHNGIVPSDLMLLRGMKRYGGTVQLTGVETTQL